MKKQNQVFNHLLLRYHKYCNKLQRLQAENKNVHRQTVLRKHILRLVKKLESIFYDIKHATAISTTVAFSLLAINITNAQTNFNTPLAGAFGLSGTNYAPSLVDLDNDGDLDLLSLSNSFKYSENVGTPSAPSFAAQQTNPFNLSYAGGYSTSLADLDNDGDFDLISGGYYGALFYFENVGTGEAANFTSVVQNPFSLVSIPSGGFAKRATPIFADLDGDGDFDILSGSYYGDFYYYENTGTVNAPNFSAPNTNPFSLTPAATNGLYTYPTFADFDSDGDLDMLSGDVLNEFYYFENTGTVNAPNYATAVINPFSLDPLSSLNQKESTVGDIDNDGDIDLFTSSFGSQILFYKNNDITLSVIPNTLESIKLHPNAAQDFVMLKAPATTKLTEIKIYDIAGRVVKELNISPSNNTDVKIDISKLSNATYFIKIKSDEGEITKKFIKK